ncbi:hypothetical protein Golomagni_01097 [Golovinomyces magnicellulatus]|nr:hypothetical protein Golomagni_01097 [Golovinomyces magnicellulatus]
MVKSMGLFKNLRAKNIQAERKACHQREEIQHHFNDFKTLLAEFYIRQDVWNFDKVDFRIGCLRGRSVIVPADVKAVYIADPGNRESITSLECVSTTGKCIESFLILKGEIIKEKLFDNDISDDAILAVSPSGFTNDRLTYQWLEHFERSANVNQELGRRWRVLVMDGHSSHLSDNFKLFFWRHQILPSLLPSHSTHLLQPLDVGIFSAIKANHQNEF